MESAQISTAEPNIRKDLKDVQSHQQEKDNPSLVETLQSVPDVESAQVNKVQKSILEASLKQDLQSSSIAENESQQEPIYAIIPGENDVDHVSTISRSESTETKFSEPWNDDLSIAVPPPKPPRVSLPLKNSAQASTNLGTSNPPSYRSKYSKEENHLEETNMSSLSQFTTKLNYSLQQRAFLMPATVLVAFTATYAALMYFRYQEKFLESLTDSKIYWPVVIVSLLAILSTYAVIREYSRAKVKTPYVQDDDGIFSAMENLDRSKCIRSITLEYSNNTNVTFLDREKYNRFSFKNKELKLTLKRPLINVEIAALLTITATYLLTKYFEIGYENLANSLEHFNTGNTELMAFTITVGIIAALLMCSFVHYYRKTHAEGLKDLEQGSISTDVKDEMILYNKEYIKDTESGNDERKSLLAKHSKGKVASLTIDQAIVEYYNNNNKVTIIPAIIG